MYRLFQVLLYIQASQPVLMTVRDLVPFLLSSSFFFQKKIDTRTPRERVLPFFKPASENLFPRLCEESQALSWVTDWPWAKLHVDFRNRICRKSYEPSVEIYQNLSVGLHTHVMAPPNRIHHQAPKLIHLGILVFFLLEQNNKESTAFLAIQHPCDSKGRRWNPNEVLRSCSRNDAVVSIFSSISNRQLRLRRRLSRLSRIRWWLRTTR